MRKYVVEILGFGSFIEYSDEGFGSFYGYSEDGVGVFVFVR